MSHTVQPDPEARLRHDLSSPLSVILAEVQLLLLQPEVTGEVRESVKVLETAALRMRALLRGGRGPGPDAG